MHQFHTRRGLAAAPLIVLLHLALVAALLQHKSRPRHEDTGPVEFMSYIVIPKPAAPVLKESVPVLTPLSPPRRRPPVARTEAQPPMTIVPAPEAAPAAPPEQASPAVSPSPSPKLDMAALRADARRAASDYAPEPFEQVRAAESRLEAEKHDLGRAIEKAKRPPCTKKYSGGPSMNLILLIPLAIDTITDKGCKW